MRQQRCFKLLDKKSYIVWSDVGPHFRCAEFMHYLFVELAQLKIKVSFNLFCERHGKNSRDQHFSTISNFLKQESMVNQLTSSLDICTAIHKQQNIANINNSRFEALQKPTSTSKEYRQAQTFAFVVPTHCVSRIKSWKLIVPNLKQHYNFFTDDNSFILMELNPKLFLKTHFMSDRTDFELVGTKAAKETVTKVKKNVKEDKIHPHLVNSKYMSKVMHSLNYYVLSESFSNTI